jgi:hypothetical protein
MAQWSETRIQAEKALKAESQKKRLALILAERAKLFKQFRDGGWQIKVLNPIMREFAVLPDDFPTDDPDYLVKMPGAHPMRIRTEAQLRRPVKGVVA